MALIDNLVAYCKMDETSWTSVVNDVGTNMIAVWSSATPLWKINYWRYFDWVSDYISPTFSLFPSWTTRTLNLWIQPIDLFWNPSSQTIYKAHNWNGSSNLYSCVIAIRPTGEFDALVYNWTTNTQAKTATWIIQTGVWQMITIIVKPNSKAKLYYNWVRLLNATFQIDDTFSPTRLAPTAYRIGRDSRDADNEFYWRMDELYLSSDEKSDAEILQLYNSGYGLQYPFILPPISWKNMIMTETLLRNYRR